MKIKYYILLFFFFPFLGFGQINLDSGLVAYYSFDGNANDMSQNGIDGIEFGPIYGNDRMGSPNKAIVFDGIDDYVVIDSSEKLNSLIDPLTITMWLKVTGWHTGTTSGGWAALISKSSSNSLHFRIVINNTGSYWLAPYPVCGNYASNAIPILDQWMFFGMLQDSNSIRFYVDGMLVDSFSCTTSLTPNQINLSIGRDPHGVTEYFQGSIDDLRIYGRVLNVKELDELHNPTTSLDKDFHLTNLSLSPNPTTGTLTLESPATIIQTISLMDLTGRRISAKISVERNKAIIETDFKGLAIVQVTTAKGIGKQKVIFE